MGAHADTEDQLVEQPALGLFAELGWAVAGPPPHAGVAGEPRDAGLLGRETKGEVGLVSRLRAALERLNPTLPSEAITAAVDELTRDRSAMSRFSKASSAPSRGLSHRERVGNWKTLDPLLDPYLTHT